MTWIRTIPPGEAQGELAELYRAIGGARGAVADVHVAQSLHPRAMRAHLELYKAVVLARSTLSRIARERIAVVVSSANRCAYCVKHHAAALRSLRDDEAIVSSLESGELPASLTPADRALLTWARRATVEPASAAPEDAEVLRAAGLDDAAILDAVLTVGYFCFVNRLVLLLGVEIEPDYERTCT